VNTIKDLEQGMFQAVFENNIEKHWPGFQLNVDLIMTLKNIGPQEMSLLCVMTAAKLLGTCNDEEIFKNFLRTLHSALDVGARLCRENNQ
jgi:hypothetical protein